MLPTSILHTNVSLAIVLCIMLERLLSSVSYFSHIFCATRRKSGTAGFLLSRR